MANQESDPAVLQIGLHFLRIRDLRKIFNFIPYFPTKSNRGIDMINSNVALSKLTLDVIKKSTKKKEYNINMTVRM